MHKGKFDHLMKYMDKVDISFEDETPPPIPVDESLDDFNFEEAINQSSE